MQKFVFRLYRKPVRLSPEALDLEMVLGDLVILEVIKNIILVEGNLLQSH